MADAKVIPFARRHSITQAPTLTQVSIAIDAAGRVTSMTSRIEPHHALAVVDFCLRVAQAAFDSYLDDER